MKLSERWAQQYHRFTVWIKLITFYELAVGMKSTMSHLIHYKPITLQYPHEKRILPDNYRGMLALLRYEEGTEKCVGCDLCSAACPSRVITVVSDEVPGEPAKRYAKEYSMDMTRCLFCGMCVQACPVDALAMTREYEWAVYDKRELLLNKQQLLAIGSGPSRTEKSASSSNIRIWRSSTSGFLGNEPRKTMRLSTLEVAHAQPLTQLRRHLAMSNCEQTLIEEVSQSRKKVLLSSRADFCSAEDTITCRIAGSCPSRAQ